VLTNAVHISHTKIYIIQECGRIPSHAEMACCC